MSGKDWFRRSERFVREYTGGVGAGDLKRLFDRDALHAYDVVTREHEGDEPKGDVQRFLHRAKALFLGLSFKLSPPRRVLFAACIVASLLALQGSDRSGIGEWQFVVLHFAAIGGLVFLIVLELADRIVVRDELEIARELQRELLPQERPELEDWDFVFSYRTANTIGGDYYDFIPLEDGRLAVVIADASGHGIAAGLLMAIASSALASAVEIDPDPATVTSFVNRALCRTGGTRAFMTMFFAVLEPQTGQLSYAAAGHPFPMLRRRGGGVVELGEGGLPLGIRNSIEPATGEIRLEPGDVLLLHTDGIAETLDATGDDYGYERLRRALELGGPPSAIHDRILDEMATFQGDAPTHDDRSLVVIARLAPIPAAP
jgi:serine phosphatase RsbU (regulator of sigma subunit)